MNILISACLLGLYCRYDGKCKAYPQLDELLQRPDIQLIPICPEQAGGLATPRPAAERQGQQVMTKAGTDVTAAYEQGAKTACALANLFHCDYAVLKEKSPSCGHGEIYDGTFTRTLTSGDGVTAERLIAQGVTVFGETGISALLQHIEQ